ncbi:MAG: hypothetical protein QM532_03400, partial [Cyanobium sp. MAG06]|nr:hypothetical protein [Cyanobium sp. MAG06]
MVVDKLPNKIINGKIVPYSIEEQTNNIGIIYIPKNLTSADSRIIQEELRKGSFMNNKELQELDRLKTMEHRIFNYKLGLYINKYIDKLLLSSKNKNPDNKKYLQLLSQQCKDSSGLNNKEIDKIKLNQNDSERIEKYLEQEGVYCNNNIDTSELLRLINEYGLQSIFLDQKFTDIYKNKSKEEYRKIRELRKKLLKLKSSIENIKKLEKTHPENKVKKIVRLIRSNIQ